MSSSIQIKFLSLDEMANAKNIDWRYEHVGIDNLGFADKAKNRVFVRAGLEPELSRLLIDHELSHLFELEGTDEDEHGIRHKKKGGFMKIFVPILGAILGSVLMPGVGSLLGGSIGSALGTGAGVATTTGLGSMLGGVAGSSLVGKPNWGSNALGGAGAALGSGLGQMAGSMFPAGSASSGAAKGAGQFLGNQAMGLLSSPTSSTGYNSMQPSGWGDNPPPLPDMDVAFGQGGAQTSTGVGEMQGLSKMPMQPGLGQAGIDLAGKSGFNNMFQGMGQGGGMEIDPTGFNNSNGGMFAF